MKKAIPLVLLVVITIVAIVPVHGEELIVNGGFEDGLNGWTVTTQGYGEVIVTTEKAYEGTHSVRLKGGVYSLSRIEQSVGSLEYYVFSVAVYLKWYEFQWFSYPPAYIYLDPSIHVTLLPTVIKINGKQISYNTEDHWFVITIVGYGASADVYIDGQYVATVAAGEINKVRLETGVYTSGHICTLYAYFDAISLTGTLPPYANGGRGTHYEDPVNGIMKAEIYVGDGESGSSATYIKYKALVDEAGDYTIYVPVTYNIEYGIEWGGYVSALLTISVYDSNWNLLAYRSKFLLQVDGDISEINTVSGTYVEKISLSLTPRTYYIVVKITVYAEGWEGGAYVDMYGSDLYAHVAPLIAEV